jgi:type VI secretion system protein ImpA
VENFWDNLYPPIEDGGFELRATPLDWIGGRLDTVIKLQPITKTGLNWFDFKQASAVGREAEMDTDAKKQNYAKTVQDGKVSGDQWDTAFNATPKAYYKNAVETLDSLLENVNALDKVSAEKFTETPPSFTPLRSSIEEVRHTVNTLWLEKRKTDPDPEDLAARAEAAAE